MMTDDIVTRLRKDFENKSVWYKDVAKAADEIERLRTELDQWRKTAAAYRYCGKCDWCEEQWEKATGNEQN